VEDLGVRGWKAVVMEDVRGRSTERAPEHEQLEKAALNLLHSYGFVHGDFRDTNIVYASEGTEPQLYVLDFDWCGHIGEATYPPIELNPEIPWHETAGPGLP